MQNIPEKPSPEQEKLLNNLLKNLSQTDAQRVQQVLNDKDATSKILSTPQAQALLKQLMGGK